jgi:hypothetical protein
MTLRRRTICWKFLDTVSEFESPSVFLGFYAAIESAADREQLSHSTPDAPVSEDRVRQRLVEAIGRSLQRNRSTLPSIGNEITINGESWHVILNATAIPHLRVAVVERHSESEMEMAYRSRLVRNLVDRSEVNYGFVEDAHLHGETWSLYLFCKIRAVKKLHESFAREPFQHRPLLRPRIRRSRSLEPVCHTSLRSRMIRRRYERSSTNATES